MKAVQLLAVILTLGSLAQAQDVCQEYRLEYGTVYDEQQVTAYRVEYEDVCEERKVLSYRPVWETELREQRRIVNRPVYETSEREERYFVEKPVWEEHVEDRSYDLVRNVFETHEREDRVIVNRPVLETQEREERFVVRRPVIETSEREEAYTVMEPVTTYRPVQVDQGNYAEQQTYEPGAVRNRLRWQSGTCVVDPATGRTAYQRGGLFWQPEQQPGVVRTQRVWIPNLVTAQVPQTSLMPRTMVRKVPVQVCRYQEEQVVRKVPVQVCQMRQFEEVRRVPVTVCKQVVEHVVNKVPVKVCRMQREEMVRKVPLTTLRYEREEVVDQVPVRVCRQEAVEQTVRVPRRIEKRVPVTYTYRVPRTVLYKVPIDPCGAAYSGAASAVVPGSSEVQRQPLGAQTQPRLAPPQDDEPPADTTDEADRKPAIGPDDNIPAAENPDADAAGDGAASQSSGKLKQLRPRVVRSRVVRET